MLGLDTLDVAIGLVFVYLMVSFVCSAAVELVELIFQQRPKKLYDGIKELVTAPWAERLYKHPLVTSLYKHAFEKGNLPSYIPSRNFALAVLNLVDNPAAAATELQDIRNRIDALKGVNEHLYQALNAIYLNAEGKAQNVLQGIEDWYNSAMDRVSGWYKRYAQWWLLGFGVVAAVAINVDTIYIVKQLATNKALRAAVVATAGQSIKDAPSTNPPMTVAAAQANLDASIEKLKGTGLPVGWDDAHPGESCWQRAIGWLLTAIAVSFGAPFWFDILNKFMVVRSTVKPKEKSGNEKSKDAK